MIIKRDVLTVPSIGQTDAATTSWVTLSPVRLHDLPRVARLQRRAFKPPLAYGSLTLLVLWLLPKVQFLIALDGKRIVGCAIGDRTDGQSRVINICVDPTARRLRIGTKLLRALETALPEGDIVLMVEQDNLAARELYRGEGYSSVGVSRDYYGRGRDGLWMQKKRTTNGAPKIRF